MNGVRRRKFLTWAAGGGLGALLLRLAHPARVAFAQGEDLRLASAAFADGDWIPKRYSCEGEDLSPPLAFSGLPAPARSLALVCDDPDAPGGTWYHWGLFDVPAETASLPEGLPTAERIEPGRQAVNDFGRTGYRGPCPPPGHGPHHYHFRLFALKAEALALGEQPYCRDLLKVAAAEALAATELVGLYQR